MKKRSLYLILIIVLLFAVGKIYDPIDLYLDHVEFWGIDSKKHTEGELGSSDPTIFPGKLSVHFLDVGQGEAIFVLFPRGQTMLVDAGDSEAGPFVISYLRKRGVQRIDFLVATHPHQDHIGGMSRVISSFEIGKIFMPRATHNTATFENLLREIQSAGKKITPCKAGAVILEDENLQVDFVAPVGDSYSELNNYSAVIYIKYGQTSFLLTGDAQAESEQEMISSGRPLQAMVLKIGHHGSHTSTTLAFLRAVSPAYAVISAGAGNSFGHPHPETLRKLAERNVVTYRTDRDGTIVFASDGDSLSLTKGNP